MTIPAYKPSAYQQAILDFVADPTNGNLIIEARAGTGKTSTLVMLARTIPSGVFLAFNKSIATELGERLPAHVQASTFHSLCFKAVGASLKARNKGRFCKLEARKTDNIWDALYGQDHLEVRAATLRLVSLMKNTALMPDAADDTLTAIMAHFDITWDTPAYSDADVCEFARAILAANNADTHTVDFDDMLYFVVAHNVKLATHKYVMVDESQDLNEVQRIILRRLLSPTSHLIAVGDPAQAIYGFRGASSDSMEQIRTTFDCTVLPLNISYRCPASVIRLAQQYVPDIEARPDAPEGSVTTHPTFKLASFEPTDLLVCRNTAPLVTTAYKMIRRRLPARILGRDIGKGLCALVNTVSGKRGTLDSLPDNIVAYRDREVERAMRRKLEQRAQTIADKCDAVLALVETMSPDDYAGGIPSLLAIITSMFDDRQQRGIVTLATVHKAKGLEAPRVFIVDAALMPSKYATQPWQQQQETNLIYVAITRALSELHYVTSKNLD